jgi:hypothetical protein
MFAGGADWCAHDAGRIAAVSPAWVCELDTIKDDAGLHARLQIPRHGEPSVA